MGHILLDPDCEAPTNVELDLLQEGGLQVISSLMGNPTTTKQISVRLGLRRARVQHIVDQLILRGIASVYRNDLDEDRMEVYYTVTQPHIAWQAAGNGPQGQKLAAVQVMLDAVQRNLMPLIHDPAKLSDDTAFTLNMTQCHMSHASAREFLQRLNGLIAEFVAREVASEKQEYALLVCLHPQLGHDI